MNLRLGYAVTPIALSALSGVLYTLGNVGYAYWPLSLVCLVPFLSALSLSNFTLRSSVMCGLVMSAAIFGSGFMWLMALTEGFIDGGLTVGLGLWLAYGFVFCINFLIFPVLLSVLHRKLGLPLVLALVSSLVVYESLQVSLFPSYLGASLIHSQFLAQAADLGGVYLLSACCGAVSVGVLQTLRACLGKELLSPSSIAAMVFPLCFLWAYGFHHYYEFENKGEQSMRVGVVQSNLVGIERSALNKVTHQKHLEQSYELLAEHEVDLIVWPESAYARGIMLPVPLDAQLISKDIDVPIAFGGTAVWQHEGKRVHSNATFLIDEQQQLTQFYFKNLLIPFAEYIPFSEYLSDYKREIQSLFPAHQSYQAGVETSALNLDGFSFASPVCYEVVRPDFVRQLVLEGEANALLSLANDSWFGESQEPAIHLAMARLRAIEHRRWFVRAANSGFSALIAPNGVLAEVSSMNERQNIVGSIQRLTPFSAYTLYGNWVVWALMLACVLIGLSRREWTDLKLTRKHAPKSSVPSRAH